MPLVVLYRWFFGFLIPLRWALAVWLWAVWFLDLDMISGKSQKGG